MNIKIIIPIKYWYLVGMSRWEALCILEFVIWVNTILNHIDTRVILPKYESSCMVHGPEWYQKQKSCQIPISYGYQKAWNPHYRYPNGIKEKDNTCPPLVKTMSFRRFFHQSCYQHPLWSFRRVLKEDWRVVGQEKRTQKLLARSFKIDISSLHVGQA